MFPRSLYSLYIGMAVANQTLTLEELIPLINENDGEMAKILIRSNQYVASLMTPEILSTLYLTKKTYALSLAEFPTLAKALIHDKKSLDHAIKHLDWEVMMILLKHSHVASLVDESTIGSILFHTHVQTYSLEHPAAKKQMVDQHPLDLAYSHEEIKPETPQREVDLAINESHKTAIAKILAKTFFTAKDLVEISQFGKEGFYTSGKVSIGGDFLTWGNSPDEAPALAAAFANQLFHTRENLLRTQQLSPTEPFNVMECGGGSGELCRNILTLIQKRGEEGVEKEKWQSLFSVIQYHLVEISPALAKQQQKATCEFKQVEVITGDARKLKTIFPTKKIWCGRF